MRRFLHRRPYHIPELLRDKGNLSTAVAQNGAVNFTGQQCVEGNRHNTGLERPPENQWKLDLIEHEHRRACFAGNARAHQCIGHLPRALGQRPIGQLPPALPSFLKCGFRAAPLCNVPIHKPMRRVARHDQISSQRTMYQAVLQCAIQPDLLPGLGQLMPGPSVF